MLHTEIGVLQILDPSEVQATAMWYSDRASDWLLKWHVYDDIDAYRNFAHNHQKFMLYIDRMDYLASTYLGVDIGQR